LFLALLRDLDQEVGMVADVGEAAVDFHIDCFRLVIGIVEVHGGVDVAEITMVSEAVSQHHADRTGAAGDACAAKA